MTNEKLLAVLGMNHNKQAVWCENPKHGNRRMGESLAELAFKLRDEVCKISCEKYHEALIKVYNYRVIKDNRQCCGFCAYQAYQIKPIDMIIASLIAKGKTNEDMF